MNILSSDSYVINSENFNNINDQLKNGCVFVQAYGIQTSGELHYEAFPFDDHETSKDFNIWSKHNAVLRLKKHLDFSNHCGYITFLKTGVSDIGCDCYDSDVHINIPQKKNIPVIEKRLQHHQSRNNNNNNNVTNNKINMHKTEQSSNVNDNDNTDIKELVNDRDNFRKPDENYFSEMKVEKLKNNDKQQQLSAVFTEADSSTLLTNELAQCDLKGTIKSQTSIEIPMVYDISDDTENIIPTTTTEVWTLLDVNFGVPLFDIDCNTKICENIVKKLSKDKSLQITMSERKKMAEKFNKFISQCLTTDEMELCKMANGPPHPCYNLAFENGKVIYWNGI